MDRLHRRHAVFDHISKLPRIGAVRINARVGSISQLHAQLYRFCKANALNVSGLAVFAQIFGRPAFFGADVVNIIAVIHIHHQPHALILGHFQTLIVDQAGMFDGADAGADRGLNPC